MSRKLKTENLKLKALVPALLSWFSRSARDLPWRRTSDPYAIWVSEIMLQQTQVKTVIPYWERWMRELPDLRSLARASEARIHKLWEGLGYYTRVRNLQKAARVILEKHDGKFPAAFDDVLDLPGIGRYTAGAICSIAFNQPAPILDGNVIRVLTRVFGIDQNPREKKTNEQLWRLAEELVRDSELKTANFKFPCSSLNQSLMELGALICAPRAPRCESCPVSKSCVACRDGRVEEFPNLAPRTAPTTRRFAAFAVRRNGRWLVRQRPAGVVNARLWEFPNLELTGAHTNPLAAAQQLLGRVPASLQPISTIRHSITRYRITLDAYHVEFAGENGVDCGESSRATRWLTPGQLKPLAFASAHKRILAALNSPKTRLAFPGPSSSLSKPFRKRA